MKVIILYILSLLAMTLFASKFLLLMFVLSSLNLAVAIWDNYSLSLRGLKEAIGCSDLHKLLKSLND